MLRRFLPSYFLIFGLVGPAFAAASLNLEDRWQRVELRSVAPLRNVSEIRIAIETKGPSIQGLIRIPGGIASNFDTGSGRTVVDLINVGDETHGYADIRAVEVLVTQSMPDQSFEVWVVDCVAR